MPAAVCVKVEDRSNNKGDQAVAVVVVWAAVGGHACRCVREGGGQQ